MSRSGENWVRSTLGVGEALPPRNGCKIQKHRPISGEECWQVWYPKLNPDDKTETASRQRTGETALQDVLDWAWMKHGKWLIAQQALK